jgi:23S rRNA (adenine2030-N6)-methyltransferase
VSVNSEGIFSVFFSGLVQMNYRHSYHAGNFADVMKHAALTGVTRYLQKKDGGFAVIDTHGGRGLYDLTCAEAHRTGEATDGIGRLQAASAATPMLEDYLTQVRSFGDGVYPGSPLLAARLLRTQDRLVAIEKHPEEFESLRAALRPYSQVQALQGDGYARLSALLPPRERRGVVLIDPPYEDAQEYQAGAAALRNALTRFATGIYLIWYPLKDRADVDGFHGELAASGARKILTAELDLGAHEGDDGERLHACGLAAINPPFGFAAQFSAALEELVRVLGRGDAASQHTQWLLGSE